MQALLLAWCKYLIVTSKTIFGRVLEFEYLLITGMYLLKQNKVISGEILQAKKKRLNYSILFNTGIKEMNLESHLIRKLFKFGKIFTF